MRTGFISTYRRDIQKLRSLSLKLFSTGTQIFLTQRWKLANFENYYITNEVSIVFTLDLKNIGQGPSEDLDVHVTKDGVACFRDYEYEEEFCI